MNDELVPTAWWEAERYAYLADLDGAGWAWEFLRRNTSYAAAYRQASISDLPRRQLNGPDLHIIEAPTVPTAATAWGLAYLENPALSALDASLFWDPDANPSVLTVHARPAVQSESDGIDLRRLPCKLHILRRSDVEQVSISDGRQSLQLDVQAGTVLDGPVVLDYQLDLLNETDSKLSSLQRLASLCRTGSFPPVRTGQRSARWFMALRALDLANSGASQREIAQTLFGARLAEQDWRTRSDYLRNRVRRLIRLGLDLSESGYRRLLAARLFD